MPLARIAARSASTLSAHLPVSVHVYGVIRAACALALQAARSAGCAPQPGPDGGCRAAIQALAAPGSRAAAPAARPAPDHTPGASLERKRDARGALKSARSGSSGAHAHPLPEMHAQAGSQFDANARHLFISSAQKLLPLPIAASGIPGSSGASEHGPAHPCTCVTLHI